ncbi:unnamed protein product [Camellia sinensis]
MEGLHELSLLNMEGCPVTTACLDSLVEKLIKELPSMLADLSNGDLNSAEKDHLSNGDLMQQEEPLEVDFLPFVEVDFICFSQQQEVLVTTSFIFHEILEYAKISVRSGFLNTQEGASDGCQDGNKVSGQLHRYEHLSRMAAIDESESLSDIDDVEVDKYLHSKEEMHYKKSIWEQMNSKHETSQGAENANTEGIIAKCDTKFNKKFSTDRLSLK